MRRGAGAALRRRPDLDRRRGEGRGRSGRLRLDNAWRFDGGGVGLLATRRRWPRPGPVASASAWVGRGGLRVGVRLLAQQVADIALVQTGRTRGRWRHEAGGQVQCRARPPPAGVAASNTWSQAPQRTSPAAAPSCAARDAERGLAQRAAGDQGRTRGRALRAQQLDAAPFVALRGAEVREPRQVGRAHGLGLGLPARPRGSACPPGETSAARRGASSISGPARILASSRSAGAAPSSSAGSPTRRCAGSMPLRAALSRVAVSACGSMSTARTRAAPSSSAATPRMPEPQP